MFKKFLTVAFCHFPIFLLFCGFLQTTSSLNQKGNKEYQEKHYDTALNAYRKAQVKSPENPDIRYNLGTTLYQLEQFQEADRELKNALSSAKTKELKATAWYNYGNTQYRLGQFEGAEKAYRSALDLNPNDKDAKYNLELLQKKKAMFDIKQNKRDQERKQNPQQSQQQQQQQQGGSGGGQDQKDQQSQNQQGDQQNQGESQEQKEKEEQKKEEQKAGEQSGKENESKKKESEQEQSQQPEKPEEQKEEPTPANLEQGEEQEKESEQPQEGQEQGEGQQKPIYQGQMSKENALRILDALKDSERELQVLRRPRPQTEHEPAKDW